MGHLLQVTCEEPVIIRPAAATPSETLFLSNVDQQVFFHVDLLVVYDAKDANLTGDAVDVLRGALSQVLVPYYFAAGRFHLNEEQGRIELNCNAAGALFSAAYCDSTIEDLGDLRESKLERKNLMLFPDETYIKEMGDIPPVTVQVTRFKCGGVVVGLLCSHTIFDGTSGANFFNTYALFARGGSLPKEEWPSADRSVLRARSPPAPSREHKELVSLPDVPARLFFNSGTFGIYPPRGGVTPESGEVQSIHMRTFVFTPKMLSKLKNIAMEDGTLAKCSSFEALTAYLWKAKALCLKELDEPGKIANLIIPVNTRLKLKTLPTNFIGNGIAYAGCTDMSNEDLCTKPLSFCTMKVQQAIAAVDEEYVHSQLDWCEANRYGAVNFLGGLLITSLNRMPFHETNFGWGKPNYVMPAPSEFEMCEYVQLLSNCTDDGGVDVMLRMYSDKMPMLEELMDI